MGLTTGGWDPYECVRKVAVCTRLGQCSQNSFVSLFEPPYPSAVAAVDFAPFNLLPSGGHDAYGWHELAFQPRGTGPRLSGGLGPREVIYCSAAMVVLFNDLFF